MRRVLKLLSFGTVGVMLLVLVFATLIEKFCGTAVASHYIYTSPFVIFLWGVLALSAFVYLLQGRVKRLSPTFGIHLALLVILSGALVTHIWGVRGRVHLRTDASPTTVYMLPDGNIARFPFLVSLSDFTLEYYPGTFAPSDYVSRLNIIDGADTVCGTVSMNNIFEYRHYRFYQSGYDADGAGVTLLLSYDPYGIAVTYCGYLLLLLSMLGFFFDRDTLFRRLLQSPLLKRGAFALLLMCSATLSAADTPRTLPRVQADDFGNLYVNYNNRICPLQTPAKDFTIKLCGKYSYKGLTAEQIVAGWLLFPADWEQEPMIEVDEEICPLLGVEAGVAAYSHFVAPHGYKLERALQNSENRSLREAAAAANEKFNLATMLRTGNLLRLYAVDTLAVLFDSFVEAAREGRYDAAAEILENIRTAQRSSGAVSLLPDARFTAEKLYNRADYIRPLAIICVALGIISFVCYCRVQVAGKGRRNRLHALLPAAMWLLFAYLTAFMFLRGYVGGYLPIANGFETMVFMAWCALLLTLILHRRFSMAVPFGLLICGLALMVAMIGQGNPQITRLIPVLQSPLLSVHVVVIMLAYSLFAFAMLNGVTALVLRYGNDTEEQIEYLAVISRIILYPAVFLLATGIFVGAVWANVSWGRYWGWDPKEVWALITMLLYSMALHSRSLSIFRRPMLLHIFCIVAFLSVIITYFGVNFLFGGLHSYA